jgi:P pilus assembly chaperone PapD
MKLFLKLTIIMCVVLCGSLVNAQKFEVSPTRLEYNLEPGQNGQMVLNIKNHADTKKNYTVTLSDWSIDEQGNISYHSINSTPKSCADWVTINPNVFELQPNEGKQINVLMKVPNVTEANSTKWAMLFLQEATEQNATIGGDKSTSAGITINPSIGVYLFQSPASYNNESAIISDFKEAVKNKSMSVDVSNTGDKIIQGKVYLIISDLQTAEETQLDAIEFTLIPGVKKTLLLDLPKEMKTGMYSLTGVLDYSPDKDLEGVVMDYTVE